MGSKLIKTFALIIYIHQIKDASSFLGNQCSNIKMKIRSIPPFCEPFSSTEITKSLIRKESDKMGQLLGRALTAASTLIPVIISKPGVSKASDGPCQCTSCKVNGFCVPDVKYVENSWYNPRNQRIFDTRRKSYLPPIADRYLKDEIRDKRVLCIGEVHSNPCHHKLQFDIVKSISNINPSANLAIGLECFYRQHQAALDDFVYVHKDFAKLKVATNWDYTWGFDINQYAKIFRYAALGGIRLVGLNVPIQVAQLVRDSGLSGIPKSLRDLLPADIDLSDEGHKIRFIESMEASGHVISNAAALNRLYEVQTLWEEYMADSAASYLNAAPKNTIMLVIAGLGHIAGRSGIPNRIAKRLSPTKSDQRPFVIVPQQVYWSPDSGLPDVRVPPSVHVCDWAWFTEHEIV